MAYVQFDISEELWPVFLRTRLLPLGAFIVYSRKSQTEVHAIRVVVTGSAVPTGHPDFQLVRPIFHHDENGDYLVDWGFPK